jgi:hypothetical protein
VIYDILEILVSSEAEPKTQPENTQQNSSNRTSTQVEEKQQGILTTDSKINSTESSHQWKIFLMSTSEFQKFNNFLKGVLW